MREFHPPPLPFSQRPVSPPDTPETRPPCETGEIRVENLLLLAVGLELGETRLSLSLEGLSMPSPSVSVTSEGDHDGTIRSIPYAVKLPGGLAATLCITVEASGPQPGLHPPLTNPNPNPHWRRHGSSSAQQSTIPRTMGSAS